MILIYFIKEKQAIDVESLNNDFVKFKNDKTDIYYENAEDFLMEFFKQHNLKVEALEKFDDSGGVYFILTNGGEFIYFEKLDDTNETVMEQTPDQLLVISTNEKNNNVQETKQEEEQEEKQKTVQHHIHHLSHEYGTEWVDEWDYER